MTDSKAKCRRQRAVSSSKPWSPQTKSSLTWFTVEMLQLRALGYYINVLGNKDWTVCVKSCLQVLPVEGRRVSLGLTAKHHLSAILSRFKGKHHTARLFGEHGPQQDSASWVENQQNCISFDVLVSLKANVYIFLLKSRFWRLREEGKQCCSREGWIKINSMFGMDPRPCEQSPWAFFI